MNNTKNINLLFFILMLSIITYSKCVTINSLFFWNVCYRYGSNSSLDNLHTNDIGKTLINKENQGRINLAFFATKNECESECKKSKYYYACIPNNKTYDLHNGIRDGTYVCWLKQECLKRTNEFEEFRNKDPDIVYQYKNGCDYLCNAVYKNRGHCMINKDFKYHCYYKTVADEMKSLALRKKRDDNKKSNALKIRKTASKLPLPVKLK